MTGVEIALDTVMDLMDSADMEPVRLAAARDWLDRAGYKPTDRQQISGPDGGPIQTEEVGFSDDDRAARIIAVLERARSRARGSADRKESDMGTVTGSTD